MIEQPDEQIEFSEQDKEDLAQLGVTTGEAPSFHTVLEVWREVLKNWETEAVVRPTPQWCNRIISSYVGITFKDMYDVRDAYFSKIGQLFEILVEEINSDPDCLTYPTAEDDVFENGTHYRALLTDWQVAFLRWELEWDCTSPNAAAELAAISEVHKMFFGQTGLTQFLDNIRFEYTEADQASLAEALEAVKAEVNGE